MLKLLVIDDVETDFRLVERQLRRGGLEADCRWVSAAEQIVEAIEAGGWSAVLSDYSVPGIEFETILHLVRSRLPDVPLILISGSLGDEAAVELLKRGVADFVLKDRLARLVPAIERSLSEARERAEHNAAAAELKRREQELAAVLRAAPVGISVAVNRVIVETNTYLRRLIGYSEHEIRGLEARALYESEEEYQRAGREMLSFGISGTSEVETRWRCKDGHSVDVLLNASLLDPQRPERGLVVTVLDITARKQSEEELRRSETHRRTLVQTIPDLIWLKDAEGVYLACNPVFERFFGAAEAQIVGKTDYDFCPREVADAFRCHDLKAIEAGGPSSNEEWITFASDGRRVLVETVKTPLRDAHGNAIGVLGVARDITGSRQVVDALRQKERYQRALLDNFPFAVWLKDTESRFLAVNHAFARTFGAPGADALVGKTDLDIAPSDMAEGYRADDRRILASRQARMFEEEIIDQGVRKWFETYKAPVIDESGDLLGTVGFARDVSDRRKAEADLAESEARFRKLFEDSAQAVSLIEDGRFVDANRAALQMLGVTNREDLVDKTPVEFSPPIQPNGRPSAEEAESWLRRTLEEGAQQFEWAHVRADGELFIAEVLLTPIFHKTRQLIHTVWRDITERKRMETALRESEFFLKETQKIARMGGWRCNPLTNTLMWTEGVYALLELPLDYKPDLETGLDFYPPASRERVAASLLRGMETGEPFAIETEMRSASGKELWVELRGFPHHEGERIAYFTGTIHDVTQRRLLDAALRESEKRANLILDTAPVAMLVIDETGRIVVANARADQVFGYAQGEMLGQEVESLMPDRFHQAHRGHRLLFAERPQQRAMGIGLDLVGRRRDGSEFPIEVGLGPLRVGDQSLVIASIVDISARRQAEADLRESQRTLQQAQAIAHVGSWVADIEAGTFDFSEESGRLVGWEPGVRATAELLPFFHPNDLPRVQVAWREGFKTGVYEIEHRIIVNGQVRWLFVKGEFAYNSAGRAVRAVGMTQDITEIRQAQEALEAHREQLEEQVARRTAELAQQTRYLRALMDNIPHPVWLKDSAGHYLASNRVDALACGRSLEAMVGATDFDLWPPEHAARYRADDIEVMQAGEQRTIEEPLAVAGRGTIWIETCKTPVFDETGQVVGTAGFARDISEQKATEAAREAALREAQRLAEVRSEFLANMSHEIRTPLNAVLGLAQVGERESAGRKAERMFRRIRDAGQLLLGTVNDILDFSKIDAGKLSLDESPFDLGEVIDRAVDVTAQRAYAKGIDFVVSEAADLPVAWVGDALRISQVLVNLLSNAVKFTDRGRVELAVFRHGNMLSLRVADTGLGIAADHLARLFQPFEQADGSTTRRFGGTGLGLAISSRLAELMGGDLVVSSQLGEGSAFELRLPLKSAGERPAAAGGRVVLAGLSDADFLLEGLAARGMAAVSVDLSRVLDEPADLVLADAAGLAASGANQSAAAAAVEAGRRLALVVTPGSAAVSGDWCETLPCLQRPLRVRHVVALLQADIGEPAHRPARTMRLWGVRVLAAEDNEVNRLVLTEMLESEGAKLECVEDGRLAVERIREAGAQPWDVVLMDIQMPVMDGYEAARRIRQLAPALPVIGLTAHAMPEERDRCLAAGMVEHLAKPIELDLLVAAILQLRGALSQPLAASPPAAPSGSDGSAAIDWSALEARFKGKREFVRRLAANMVQTHADSPARLREAARCGDVKTIAFLAHSIKGMAGNLLAHAVQDIASQTDLAARNGAAETAEQALRLADAFDGLLAQMAARVAEN